jgi:GntR family carbon starvation induced transcriptional regulator
MRAILPMRASPDTTSYRRVPPETSGARSLSEFVFWQLRSDILCARLAPGTKLNLRFLMPIYHVGISPLRDALAQLAGDGLVILEAQRGFRVAPVSREDLSDVATARRQIEPVALSMSIDCGGDDWRKRVTSAFTSFCTVKQKVGDLTPIDERWEERHRAFHLALISACRSPTLLRFCAQLHDRFDRYRRMALPTRSHMSAIGDDHELIMRAALNGRTEDAAALLRSHFDEGFAVVKDNFDPLRNVARSIPFGG